ncbi:hypothetical protein CsSME_00017319 [Camellia sinensis var. sinensis]
MDFEIQSDFEAPSPPSSAPASTPYLSLSLSLFWKFILMASETLEDKKQEEIANVKDKGEVKEEGKTEEGEEEKEAELLKPCSISINLIANILISFALCLILNL